MADMDAAFDTRPGSEPWRWATAWVEAVAVWDAEKDEPADAASIWVLTHPDLQRALIADVDGLGYLDGLVGDGEPAAHAEWDAFAPQMMTLLRAMLPGVYYGVQLFLGSAAPEALDREAVAYGIGLRRTKPDFRVTIERDAKLEGWRVVGVMQECATPGA